MVISRALSTRPKVVILDEPTRGIDAAARSDVYGIIRQLKEEGVAVLMLSLIHILLNNNDFLYLSMQGAVGDLLSHFFDKEGKLLNTPIEERLISTPLETLKSLKNVIGVAAGTSRYCPFSAA